MAMEMEDALRLIRSTRGYESVAIDLAQLWAGGKIRFNPELPDRANTELWGTITIGPEAASARPLSLAQTLVHEHHHLRHQHPLQKTASFWSGVASRTNPMRAYEKPAYQAALDFLDAVEQQHPNLALEARMEMVQAADAFESGYNETITT